MPTMWRPGEAISCQRLILAAALAVGLFRGGDMPAAWAQAQTTGDLTKTDIVKLKTIDASQWPVLGVRLGDSRESALKTLQAVKNIKVQEATVDVLAGNKLTSYVSLPNDWPTGKYRADIYLNDKLLKSVDYTVDAAS